VYLLQDGTGTSTSLPVSANGRSVGTVSANTYLALAAEPGPLLISITAAAAAATRVQVEAGKVYYVSAQVNPAGIPVFKVLPPSAAQPALARHRPARIGVVEVARAPLVPAPSPSTAPAPKPKPAPPKPAAAPARAETPAPATGNELVLQINTGSVTLSDQQQQWFGVATNVDGGASGVFDVELDFVFPAGWAVGAEYITYKNSWTQAGGAGSFSTRVFTINGKKYFNATELIRPFVGVGIGVASTSFSGAITGGTSGTASQLMGGVEFRFDNVGLQLELKSISAKTEDSSNVKVDASGRGVFAGASFHF
jgi:hypothetical protein